MTDTGCTYATLSPISHRWFSVSQSGSVSSPWGQSALIKPFPQWAKFSAKIFTAFSTNWMQLVMLCSQTADVTRGRLPVKGGSTLEVLRTIRGGTQGPHLFRVCTTGSLALYLQNYSRLCCSDLSVFFFLGESEEFGQLSRSGESPCGTVMYLCGPVLFCLLSDWEKNGTEVKKKRAHWTETFFKGLFSSAYCCCPVKTMSPKCQEGFLKKVVVSDLILIVLYKCQCVFSALW